MSLSDILNYRRAVRHFDAEKPLDSEKVKQCLQLATLAPSSSNMQLYEFYHITDKALLEELAVACLSQQSTRTAQQMVVFVTRQDLYKQRAKTVLDFQIGNIKRNTSPERQENQLKKMKAYYSKLMPFAYSRFFGLIGLFRKLLATCISFRRPIYINMLESDARIVTHKSCGLSAQTFMLAMAEQGYDTCPLEGFDSGRVKKILNLPCGAEINMIVCCGIRTEKGIQGERYRLPFEEVYRRR
ncbi:TPA: nitroreductase family protein [Pasteurella multocida]|nr:nitroreductase family protein [Pasteurella multocida]